MPNIPKPGENEASIDQADIAAIVARQVNYGVLCQGDVAPVEFRIYVHIGAIRPFLIMSLPSWISA